MALEKNDFVQIEKIVEKSTENLAVMINGGFNATQKIINENQKFNNQRFDQIDKRFDTLESGHEDIKLRLDNVAYRFELIELQSRVKRLEKKAGIS